MEVSRRSLFALVGLELAWLGGVGLPTFDRPSLPSQLRGTLLRSVEQRLLDQWTKSLDAPPLQILNDLGDVEVPTWGHVSEIASQFGLTVVNPVSLAHQLAESPSPVGSFELLRAFSIKHYGIDLYWEDNRPIMSGDIASIYAGIVALAAFPLELHEARRQQRTAVFRFARDVTPACRDGASGCAADDGSLRATVRQPGDLDRGYDDLTAGTMVHEFAHEVEATLLADKVMSPTDGARRVNAIAHALRELDPPGFQTIDFDTFRNNPERRVPFPTAVAEPYGQVESETVSTLFEHLAFGDVGTFVGFDRSELNYEDSSVRVRKLARLVAHVAQVVDDGTESRDYAGFVGAMFTGMQTSMVSGSHPGQTQPLLARATVDDYTYRRTIRDTTVAVGNDVRIDLKLVGPGIISGHRYVFVRTSEGPASVRMLKADGRYHQYRQGSEWEVGNTAAEALVRVRHHDTSRPDVNLHLSYDGSSGVSAAPVAQDLSGGIALGGH